MFNALRQQATIYILEKGENPTLKIGFVESFSKPMPKYPTTYQPSYQVESVVDIKVRVGEETIEFQQLPANTSIANYNNASVVVSDNREAITAEVEAMLRNSQQAIDSIPTHERTIKACTEFLKDLNPQFKKDKEQQEKIEGLESRMGEIDNTLQNIQAMLANALGGSKKTKNE